MSHSPCRRAAIVESMTASCRVEKIAFGIFNKLVLAVAPDLPRPALSYLHQAHELRRYSPGEVLISERDPRPEVLFLCSGTVRLSLSPREQTAEQRGSRKAVPSWELTAPAALGLSGILNGGVFCHNAIAKT